MKIIKKVDNYLLSMSSPQIYSTTDPESVLVTMDAQFGQICASLEDAGVSKPNKLTVFDFYQRVGYYENKAKRNKRENN
jgi:hypothetical protein